MRGRREAQHPRPPLWWGWWEMAPVLHDTPLKDATPLAKNRKADILDFSSLHKSKSERKQNPHLKLLKIFPKQIFSPFLSKADRGGIKAQFISHVELGPISLL